MELNELQSVDVNAPVTEALAAAKDNTWLAKLNPLAVPIVTSPVFIPPLAPLKLAAPISPLTNKSDLVALTGLILTAS